MAAANEVHDAVMASRTASRAKKAAETAAKNAHQICQTESFSSAEEVQQAQARASSLRGQAIHAAVVEYEAITAKRQSTLALATDVKCWNVHRKQQLMTTCLDFVKFHRKMAVQSLDAWEGLRDDLLHSSSITSIVNSSVQNYCAPVSQTPDIQSSNGTGSMGFEDIAPNAKNGYFANNNLDENDYSAKVLQHSYFDRNAPLGSNKSEIEMENPGEDEAILNEVASSYYSPGVESNSFHDTFEENFSLDNEENEGISSESEQDCETKHYASNLDNQGEGPGTKNHLHNFEHSTETQEDDSFILGNTSRHDLNKSCSDQSTRTEEEAIAKSENDDKSNVHYTEIEDGMSSSMQSLVDGLMNWGGQWDEEEDHTALIDGIATSIMEEEGVFNSQ